MINLPEVDKIYFSKIKEYFKEVLSSYYNGNYRSANVMLYSIVICDLLLKLKELSDMYDDDTAKRILAEVESERTKKTGSKSVWEKTLEEKIKKETELIDDETKIYLDHLYDLRNLSAHPVLNNDYELCIPTKEITIANIKNMLNGVLTKPPIFISDVVNRLTNDLENIKSIYINDENKLNSYLCNRYYSCMDVKHKKKLLKTLWKFCFNSSDDVNCMSNLVINRKALKILIISLNETAIEYIKEESKYFLVASDRACIRNLVILLSELPQIYLLLQDEVQLKIKQYLENNEDVIIAWFLRDDKDHLEYLKEVYTGKIQDNFYDRLVNHYTDVGLRKELLDFFIYYFGHSDKFDSADYRYERLISPFLDEFTCQQLEELINFVNNNNQINNRRRATATNKEIYKVAQSKLPKEFKYPLIFDFD